MSRLYELTVECPDALGELLGEELVSAGAGAVEEREAPGGVELSVCSEDRLGLEALSGALAARLGELTAHDARFASVTRTISQREDAEWSIRWTRFLRPERLTPRIVLAPEHSAAEIPDDAIGIVFRPVMAFGDGAHPTTRLAAQAVERRCLAQTGLDVLDFGTGTGVLSMVAVLSGACHATGVDSDPVAVAASRTNAELNALGQRCTFDDQPLGELETTFDLIVANVDAETMVRLAPELTSVARPSAGLLLTGVLDEHADEVERAYAALGWTAVQRVREQEWALLELERG